MVRLFAIPARKAKQQDNLENFPCSSFNRVSDPLIFATEKPEKPKSPAITAKPVSREKSSPGNLVIYERSNFLVNIFQRIIRIIQNVTYVTLADWAQYRARFLCHGLQRKGVFDRARGCYEDS
jgi:hypothetical protein